MRTRVNLYPRIGDEINIIIFINIQKNFLFYFYQAEDFDSWKVPKKKNVRHRHRRSKE